MFIEGNASAILTRHARTPFPLDLEVRIPENEKAGTSVVPAGFVAGLEKEIGCEGKSSR